MLTIKTHELTAEETSHWSPGELLGSGCDKYCHEALYDGKRTEYVLKMQRAKPIFGQVAVEVELQDELLSRIDRPEARAALSRIAYVLGVGEMPATPEDYDNVDGDSVVGFQICEKVDMEHDRWGASADAMKDFRKDGAIELLSDMGSRNYGRRTADGAWVCIDCGVCTLEHLLNMGVFVALKEGDTWN